jgi:D-cysteine desulfhydrase family pyridoxal phosphate-dependent enzyme
MSQRQKDELLKRIARFPRKNLIHLPTPFRKLENLSLDLGGPDIYVKRDDLTGLAFGGNKSRKLEFIIADALNKGAEVIITWASLQSNWCLQTAAAARRFGLRPVMILFQTSDLAPEYDGNLLLDYILAADIHIREAEKGKAVSEDYARDVLDEVVNEVKEWGHTPYVVAVGGSMPGFSMKQPLGAISYVAAFAEMLEQTEAEVGDISHVVVATGSGATQAGLAVGAKALSGQVKVLGISVSEEKKPFAQTVLKISSATEKSLGLDLNISLEDIIIFDEYIKDGYGIMDKEVAEVIRLVFSREGIVLDPVYTGKAMTALVDLIKQGFFKKKDKIVFFHTGGTPALFPYRHKLVELLK